MARISDRHGESLDYACTYDVTIDGEDVALIAARLDWQVRTAVEGTWDVQSLPPGEDAGRMDEDATTSFEYTNGLIDTGDKHAP